MRTPKVELRTAPALRPVPFKILHTDNATRRERQGRQPAPAEELEDRVAAPEALPAELDWEQVDERLKGAIDALAPAYRTVLLLWAVEGFKYRSMDEITDVAN